MIHSVKTDDEGPFSPRSPITSAVKSGGIEGEDSVSTQPLTTPNVAYAGVNEEAPASSRLVKEHRSSKRSPGVDKLPPHLRKSETMFPEVAKTEPMVKYEESALSPLPSSDKLAPPVKSGIQVPLQALPVRGTTTKPDEQSIERSPRTSHIVSAPIAASGTVSSDHEATNLKEALFFKAWPKSEARDTPGSLYSILMLLAGC